MRLGYSHNKELTVNNKYWNNTVLPLLENGSLEHAINNTYAYPNRIGLYPGLSCPFFCTFCGRNYSASYNTKIADKSLEVFKKIIDQDPKKDRYWTDRFRISGGLEPLTNPHIGKIISYGNSKGFNMQLYTNGYGMSQRFLDAQPGLYDLEAIRISLYGYNVETYYNTTKNKNAYEIVLKNIKNFLKSLDHNKKKVKVGLNYIILPGHIYELKNVFDLIKIINEESENKIQFLTLREDFSQSNNFISNVERKEMHKIFLEIEKFCFETTCMKDLHIDYGYALYPVRHGMSTGPLKMATSEQMNVYGFPQIATSVDSLGNMYVYHESNFLERPGSTRYIIGNILQDSIPSIIQKHLNGKGIKPLPFDIGFLDAFDHTVTLLIHEAKNNINNSVDWKEYLINKWKPIE